MELILPVPSSDPSLTAPKNIGLQARILSTRTFTIFVVMALLTTFATTPLVSVLYPPWYQKKLEAWKRGEIDWDSGEQISGPNSIGEVADLAKPASNRVRHLLVYLRLDNMPAMLNLVSLFGSSTISEPREHPAKDEGSTALERLATGLTDRARAVRAHGLRLIQLTDRDSSVMTVSEVDEHTRNDPIVNLFRTVGQFLKVAVSAEVAVMPENRFAEALLAKSSDILSDLILLPWSETGNLSDPQASSSDSKLASSYTNFAKSVLASVDHNIAIFFPNGSRSWPGSDQAQERNKLMRAYSFNDIHREIAPLPVTNQAHHIFMPFIGGKDDRFALTLILQLCEKQDATATVVHLSTDGPPTDDTDYFGYVSTHVPAAVAPRVEFKSASVSNIGQAVLSYSKSEIHLDSGGTTWHNLIVLGRRSAANADAGNEMQECLGPTAQSIISAKLRANLLVVQAKVSGS